MLTSVQLDKKDRLPMVDMFTLPWEEQPASAKEMTMEERKERINQILNEQ